MTTTQPTPLPISLPAPVAPDADWETVRARSMQALVTTASPAWTDHNVADPGVTLLEAAAFGIADMHYRVAGAQFSDWPLGWHGWLAEGDRHWASALPSPAPTADALGPVADALRKVLRIAGRDAEREVATLGSRHEAESLLSAAPFAAAVPSTVRASVVSMLRSRTLRRVALEHADVVADAVAQADAAQSSAALADAAAAAEVGARTGLWSEECAALVRRERRRMATETARANAGPIAAATVATYADVIASLEAASLTPAEAVAAAAAPRLPVGITPETLEGDHGASEVWPPHPIQALTCEPVTAADYARRARTHPQVKRAWAVRGRLEGIAWNGLPTYTAAQLAAGPPSGPVPSPALPATDVRRFLAPDTAAAAITIVVESDRPATDDTFHRKVLAHAIGTEVFSPFPSWRDDTDALDPRRVVCDEVGIAPLRTAEVEINGTLLIPPTASRGAVTAAAGRAIDDFFAAGRPERLGENPFDDPLTGPWEPAPQPEGGWVPGESIRLSEVVERLVAVPEVIAVTELTMRVTLTSVTAGGANGLLPVPAGRVPVRAPQGCFSTNLNVTGSCDA